jgi:molecular chaperone DnaK (HSP70)
MKRKQPILGIDLGTTYSLACLANQQDRIHFFTPEGEGEYLVPSVFFHRGGGEVLVGTEAEAEEAFHPLDVIRNVKRSMDRNYPEGDLPPESFKSSDRSFLPYQVSGHILRALKRAAEREFEAPPPDSFHGEFDFNGSITGAVVTVPAYFGPREREATRDAAVFAGFTEDQVTLLDEPVAAALSMGLQNEPGRRLIMVVDLGGGTCDITALQVGQGVPDGGFCELGRIGDNKLGGIDIDRLIVEATINNGPIDDYSFEEQETLIWDTNLRMRDLQAERAKKRLCEAIQEGRSHYEQLNWLEREKNRMFETEFTDDFFEKETDDILEYVVHLCDFLLNNIDRSEAGLRGKRRGLRWNEIDMVYMVGGGARIPHLRNKLIKKLGGDQKKLSIMPKPQQAVAEGAALYASMIAEGKTLKAINHPRCPCDIGYFGETIPKVSLLNRFKEYLPFAPPPPPSGTGERAFFALIRSNSLLSDIDQRSRKIDAPVLDSKRRVIEIPICQRFVSRYPRDVVNGSEESDQTSLTGDSQGGVNFQYRSLRRLRISVPENSPETVVTIQITYAQNHEITIKVQHGEQVIEERVAKDAFVALFDFQDQ